MADRKMRNPKLSSPRPASDDAFDSFVDGADPLSATDSVETTRPWDELPKTPKARMMLLLEPADKARLDFLSEKTGRSAQHILRAYFETALRRDAESEWDD